MNKKAVIPVIAWIVIIVIGLFAAKQVGLFAVFTPNVGQPSGTNSLVLPGYYDAKPSLVFACAQFPLIVRAQSSDFSSTSNWIVHNENGVLQGYTYNSIVTDPQRGNLIPQTTNLYSNGASIFAFKGTRQTQVPTGMRLCSAITNSCTSLVAMPVCQPPRGHDCGPQMTTQTVTDYYAFNQATIPDSSAYATTPCPTCFEKYDDGSNGINPFIKSSAYVCKNSNVYLQDCSSYTGSVLTQTCPSVAACLFSSTLQTPEGAKPGVKCNAPYLPNQALCVGTTLYQTSSNGQSINSTQCGFTCTNGICQNCKDGTKRCAQLPGTTTSIEICSNSQWTQWNDPSATCSGERFCQETGDVNTRNAVCQVNANASNGDQRCYGNGLLQPQIFSSSDYLWHDNGPVCHQECRVNNNVASCVSQCAVGFTCGGGTLWQCSAVPPDNSNNIVGACYSGNCSADNLRCSTPHNVNDIYCNSGALYKAVSSSNPNDLGGGVTGSLITNCINGCQTLSSSTAQCTKLDRCIGHEGKFICKTDGIVREKCSTDGQTIASTEDCAETLLRGYCRPGDTGQDAVCVQPTQQCSGSKTCENGKIVGCSGGFPTSTILDSCNNLGCSGSTDTTVQCNDQCTGNFFCNATTKTEYNCVNTPSQDSDSTQKVLQFSKACGSIGCDITTNQCRQECTPNTNICSGGVIKQCTTLGGLGATLDTCNGAGCDSVTNACIDQCNTEGTTCNGRFSNLCHKNLTNNQWLSTSSDCGSVGCNPSNGQCAVACPGTKKCINDIIYSCSNGNVGSVLDSCNGLGCDVQTNICKDASSCTAPGYTCSSGSSIYCYVNITNNQLLKTETTCGVQGCDTSSGKCSSTGVINGFVCIGDNLHSTDANGYESANPIKICSSEALRNGLQPFCYQNTQHSIGDCSACILSQYVCANNVLGQCGDAIAGTLTNTNSCPAGCSAGVNTYCDSLTITPPTKQNFAIDEQVSLRIILTGSQSHRALDSLQASARIIGTGVDQQVNPSFGTNGVIDFGFGTKPIGIYNITIQLPEYSQSLSYNVKVTNDFIITLSSQGTILQIPGTTSKALLTAVKNGAYPSGLKIMEAPSAITASIPSTSNGAGQWDLVVSGPEGTYTLKISAVENGVTLDPQTVTISLAKPSLKIELNAPTTATPGTQTYDIAISGPTAQATSGGIAPDSLTLKITKNGVPQTITTTPITGLGRYSFSYNFADTGTYIINVDAAKTGYAPASIGSALEISQGGTTPTPGNPATTGNGTIIGTGTTGGGTGLNIPWYAYVGAAIAAYFIWRKKKK